MKRKHNFYDYLIILVLVLVAIIMLYPFWHEFMYSFSDPVEAATGGMFLLPRGFNLKSYWSVFCNVGLSTKQKRYARKEYIR